METGVSYQKQIMKSCPDEETALFLKPHYFTADIFQ
jgi:hypothetical protein